MFEVNYLTSYSIYTSMHAYGACIIAIAGLEVITAYHIAQNFDGGKV